VSSKHWLAKVGHANDQRKRSERHSTWPSFCLSLCGCVNL